VTMMTEGRGFSNAKAKRELGWKPRYSSWRQGFADLFAEPTAETTAPRSVSAAA
jgi:nucleoside-diphosphate-sugar epimerase